VHPRPPPAPASGVPLGPRRVKVRGEASRVGRWHLLPRRGCLVQGTELEPHEYGCLL